MCLLELRNQLRERNISLREYKLAFHLQYPRFDFVRTINQHRFQDLIMFFGAHPFPLENADVLA